MTLLGYTAYDIESLVRRILQVRGTPRPSSELCKAWARSTVKRVQPRWPEVPLTAEEEVLLGRYFIHLLFVDTGERLLDGTAIKNERIRQ